MSASKMLRQGAITDQNGSIAKTFFSSPAGHAPSNMELHARIAALRECRAGRGLGLRDSARASLNRRRKFLGGSLSSSLNN
jgi:hypothetical protein